MTANGFVRRFLLPLLVLAYVLGFWAPWERYGGITFAGSTVWTAIPAMLFRQRWLDFSVAARSLLILSAVLAVVAAALSIWAEATPVPQRGVQGGPRRLVRQPLATAGICHVLAVSLLMPPSGAVVAILLVAALWSWRVAGSIDQGPGAETASPGGSSKSNWLSGVLSSGALVGTAGGFVIEGAPYNGTLILRWLLVGFGVQLIWGALRTTSRTQTT